MQSVYLPLVEINQEDNLIRFRYDPTLLGQFPNIVGGVILLQNVVNTPSPAQLIVAYHGEQSLIKHRIGDTPLSELPSLSAWRSTFSAFGIPPTKYRNAAEALLRRLTKKGDIPSINMLVDIGNLISIRYALPVAIFDIRELIGSLTVRFATGTERFTELGSDEIAHPEVGEVIFTDDSGLVFARRWCWKQSHQSAASLDSHDLLFTIEAQHESGSTDIKHAISDLQSLLKTYTGATYPSAILTSNHPTFSTDENDDLSS